MQKEFDIPVGLFIFKRKDAIIKIVKRLSTVKPNKVYLIADQGRNEKEKNMALECREVVEKAIDWECEVIKYYAEENRGVYENIGKGAKWVLSREKWAIFLEDDNLPEESFFYYCQELLERYENNPKVLWICGTNYLGQYHPSNDVSYMFTKHLLPCGWASWGSKYQQYYDGEMTTFSAGKSKLELRDKYQNKKLFRYQFRLFERTVYRLRNQKRCSWDYQMAYSVRVNDLYGISPRNNQIENIGVDEHSEHGGGSGKKTMTKRFCGMKSYPLEFPLIHPQKVEIDPDYEKIIGNTILPPWYNRIWIIIGDIVKKVLGIDKDDSLSDYLRDKRMKKH